ncbi:hypothetical protein OG735_23800 [Streptomyces sp. NBC_01210]|uniref:hypothetical protein n=1 Tax=Streptomyces sp. NBC_01210 TaxID=2903774 RepID=UPI002E14BE94|nr:hypothetical protein OG735_23800 [Streptomyces sp. NBC_01210]
MRADTSHQPAVADESALKAPFDDEVRHTVESAKAAAPTSKSLWLSLYFVALALVLCRLPTAFAYAETLITPKQRAEIGDPALEDLAVNVAVGGGVLLTVFVYACYVFVARALERRVFTASRSLGRGVRTGAFFPVLALCLVPPQLAALAFEVVDPTQGIVYYLYIAAVVLLVPVFFRGQWRHLPPGKIIALYCCSIGLAAFTAVG